MAPSGNLKKKRALVLRLSSLGDVVLTTSALHALGTQFEEVHYVTTPEYALFLDGHPNLTRVWIYDKSSGLKGWLKLGEEISVLKWDAVFDLHLSLRTRLARRLWKLRAGCWKSLPKPYGRRLGVFALKRLWPKRLNPPSYRELFALTVDGRGDEATDLSHLKKESFKPQAQIGVMPSSRWKGKEPPLALITEWFIKNARGKKAVVFGTKKDEASLKLLEHFKTLDLPVESRMDVDRDELVRSILECERVVGADTGLIHVAEALGVPVHVWYGPTAPELGFGPSLAQSTVEKTSVFCSPCSKDGRHCYRVDAPYACWENRQ